MSARDSGGAAYDDTAARWRSGFNPSVDSRQLNFSPRVLSLLPVVALDLNDNYGYEDASPFGAGPALPKVNFCSVCGRRRSWGGPYVTLKVRLCEGKGVELSQ